MASVMPDSLDAFVAAVLRISQDGFATEPMMRLLTEARLPNDAVLQCLRFDEERYTRHLIHRTDDVEVLALAWPKESATPIHDHAGQRCWMVAHSGSFVVDDYRQVAGTRKPGYAVVERIATTAGVTVGMPDYRQRDDRDIHRVSLAPGCERAVSIHIYARPYSSCLIFDEDSRQAREIPMNYDPL